MPKAGNPCIVRMRSSNERGTSSDTTRSVVANANTASLNPSTRETSPPRVRNPPFTPRPRSIAVCRTTRTAPV